MRNSIKNDRALAHILMIFLVFCWGFDYVPAKWALELMSPSAVAFFKYSIGLVCVLTIKFATGNKKLVRKKDLPIIILCAVFGQALYFECEYNAMEYMPVALITIILSFVPVVSVVVERILYKRKANSKIIIGILVCIIGVILVIGADLSVIFQGRWIGYLLAIGAVFSWNIYNFITASLDEYDGLTLSMTQMICTTLILIPLAFPSMPAASEFDMKIILGLLWIGLFDSGFGYLILVYGLQKLGPTTSSLYSNFLPVTTAFFGVLFLGEKLTALQIIGGIIVIAAGFIVIREKGKLDEKRLSQ